jgi:hypothetical protein
MVKFGIVAVGLEYILTGTFIILTLKALHSRKS